MCTIFCLIVNLLMHEYKSNKKATILIHVLIEQNIV